MSSTVIYVGLPEDSRSSIAKTLSTTASRSVGEYHYVDVENSAVNTCDVLFNRVPNAPKSCIAEIFNGDTTDGGSLLKNSASRTRVVRDTPTRPRDTHSRLFGQVRGGNGSVIPLVTDTIRSNIQFGEEIRSPALSPKMNGTASSTPIRHDPTSVDHCERFNSIRTSYNRPKRNPVTGDGFPVLPPRRRHPGASLREGNPITGDGYKSMNGQINMVTTLNGEFSQISNMSRVPPGGFSSGLW